MGQGTVRGWRNLFPEGTRSERMHNEMEEKKAAGQRKKPTHGQHTT